MSIILFCLVFPFNNEDQDKPFYFETYKWLSNHTSDERIIIISLLEHGGKFPKNNNWGNIRNSNLTYKQYSSLEEGFLAAERLLQGKYKGMEAKDIAVIYSESPKEWLNRYHHWENLIKHTINK